MREFPVWGNQCCVLGFGFVMISVALGAGSWILVINSLAHGGFGCNFKNPIFKLALLIGTFKATFDKVLRWMIQDITDDKSTLVQVMFACLFCLFVSLLSHFWLIHLFFLHPLYQPYVGLCQATRVQSHQRQSTSAVAIATCEVQVSAADYQNVPTVATEVSKPLCCRLTLTFTLTSENLWLYITLLL